MTQATETRTTIIHGTVQDVAFKPISSGERKGQMFGEYKILPQGARNPVTVRDFNKAMEGVEKSQYVSLEMSERDSTYTDDQGKERSVTYRNAMKLLTSEDAAPQPAPREPQAAPYSSGQTNGGSGWREAYSQSREAHEDTRLSIESQKSYEMAMNQVRDLVVTGQMSPMEDIGKYRRLLTDLTVMGMAAMREARENA